MDREQDDQEENFFKADHGKSSALKKRRICTRTAIVLGVLVIFLIVVIILIWWSWPRGRSSSTGYYDHAAVASDAAECSTIGKDILESKKGSAVDSAIATLICLGVHSAMSCGIGGGFQMVVYDVPREKPENGSKVIVTFDARETAPLSAKEDMNLTGANVIGVPGEVRGYFRAWEQFGRLKWSELFTPTIEMCRNGFHVSWALAKYILLSEDAIRENTGLSKIFLKPNGEIFKEGDLMHRHDLADTLERIQSDPHSMYNGSLANDIVSDIKDFGGNITLEDLKLYEANSTDTNLSIPLDQHELVLHTLRPPSSGVLFGFMMRLFESFNLTSADIDGTPKAIETYHKLIETFKFGYALRTYLGDEKFVDIQKVMKNLSSDTFLRYIHTRINLTHTQPISYYDPEFDDSPEDHGTSHLSVISPNGGAVSVTTTINNVFGSKLVGNRTAIIFNDEMNDFTLPGNSTKHGNENYIKPGKRPMSSMCPGIVVNKNGDVVLVVGAAGGKRITSAATFVAVHNLMLGQKLKKAVDMMRLHHQLDPNVVYYDQTFPEGVLDGLRKKGHNVTELLSVPSVVQAIQSSCHTHQQQCITAVCDWRKKGKPDGF